MIPVLTYNELQPHPYQHPVDLHLSEKYTGYRSLPAPYNLEPNGFFFSPFRFQPAHHGE